MIFKLLNWAWDGFLFVIGNNFVEIEFALNCRKFDVIFVQHFAK